MAERRSVVLNGDLGSGKSTVSMLLAVRLGIRRVSVGELYRAMAAQRGLTALQLNLHAELDDKIDHYVDQLQGDLATSGEQVIVDSRLAWYYFHEALKVHLIADPMVAARRVLARPTDVTEAYGSLDEARRRIAERDESERARFISRYGADKARLRNYDLVCDSTSATPGQIVERIVDALEGVGRAMPRPVCFLDPKRIYPTGGVPATGPAEAEGPITVGYTRPFFFVIDGHRRLSAAIHADQPLIPARLLAEGGEEIAGQSCERHFTATATPARVRDWEQAHGIVLPRAR